MDAKVVRWEGECELRDQTFHVAAWIVPAVKGYSTRIDSRSYLKPGTPAYVKDLIVTDPDGDEVNLGAWSLEQIREDVLEQYLLNAVADRMIEKEVLA